MFTNGQGGILDDAMIQVLSDQVLVISNAGTAAKIAKHLKAKEELFQGDVDVVVQKGGQNQGFSMIALQGG